MADKDQVKPLASATAQLRSDDDLFRPPPAKLHSDGDLFRPPSAKLHLHRNKYIMCYGCFAALLLIIAVIGIVLGFTVLHIKTPDIKIDALSFSNTTSDGKLIVVASVSVRNPNFALFKYSKVTTEIYYRGEAIGEGEAPPGEVKAKDTMKMNVTVDIETEKMDDDDLISFLMKDLNLGALNINSYTEVPGRVKIIGFIKKNLVVKMNCSLTYNSKIHNIQGQQCDQRVKVSD